jgi:uncharacterized membrane protein
MSVFAKSTDTEGDELEAAAAIAFALALQILVALLSEQRGWEVWTLPWWVWLVLIGPEVALLFLLWLGDPRGKFVLAVTMGLVNGLALVALIGSVATSHENSAGQLLLKGVTVWFTNVTAFGIAFWELHGRHGKRHWRFPQQETHDSKWRGPTFFDYFYVSFTNSIAFSPTDAMPMTKTAKLLMLGESAVSAIAILFVAARAVNIFK